MNITRQFRRIPFWILGILGLSWPACAAVCPKGRGACPYPGQCFLFADTDSDALCDYTSRTASGTSQPGGSSTGNLLSSPSGTDAGSAVPAASQPDPGIVPAVLPGGILAGLIAGITAFLIVFAIVRSGAAGIRMQETGPALAISGLSATGVGGIAVYLAGGPGSWASPYAIIYILAGSVLTAYLWKSGAVSRPVVSVLAVMSTLLGFVLPGLLMPAEFAGIVRLVTGNGTLTPVIPGLLAGIGLVFIVGRTFCGHLCPVGSVQELAWNLPGRKIGIRKTGYLEGIRLAVFSGSAVAALCLLNLPGYTGIPDFFSLTLSAGLIVFLLLIVLSSRLYRPVCRAICPFGLIFSIPARFSRYRIRRTGLCTGCGRCERACPAHSAGKDSSRHECYLCARCTGACPVTGALVYDTAGGDHAPAVQAVPDPGSPRDLQPVRE